MNAISFYIGKSVGICEVRKMKKHFPWKKANHKIYRPVVFSGKIKNGLLNVLAVFLLVSILLSTGCIESDNGDKEPDTTNDDVILGGLNEFVNSSNDFSFDMYAELNEGSDNLFFSPYSITTALGMAYEGAKGNTAEEMEDVLDIPANDSERLEMMKDLQSLLNRNDASYELSTANAYWLREDGSLREEYKEAIEAYYLAHGEKLDFAGDPAGAVDTINTWVEEQTNDRIKDLLSEGDVDPMTYLILTNAIYFKSDWKYQFDTEATEEMDFHTSGGEEESVQMMRMNDESKELNHAANDDVQILQLPYDNNEIYMYVLLPKENDISSLETELDGSYLANLQNALSPEHVDLYLPKFKFEQKYRLKKNLIDMGMPTSFGAGADFTGISDEAEGLYIDEVIHQSFVEVNEEGTEAAAATAVIMREGSMEPSSGPVEFRADHPFIFFIQHKETGQILFMGKVENPNG